MYVGPREAGRAALLVRVTAHRGRPIEPRPVPSPPSFPPPTTTPHAPTHATHTSLPPAERPLTIKFRTDADDEKPPAAAQPETKASRGSRYRDDAPSPSAEPAQHPSSDSGDLALGRSLTQRDGVVEFLESPALADHMRTALKRRESGRRVEAAHARADDDEEDDVIRALEERKR